MAQKIAAAAPPGAGETPGAGEKPGLLVSTVWGYLLPEFLAEAAREFRVVRQEVEFAAGGADRQWPEIVAAVISVGDRYLDAPGVLDRLPNLRVVANHGVGVEHVDQAAFKSRGILVTHTPGVVADATADAALLLMLNVARRQRQVFDLLRVPGEPKWFCDRIPLGRDLAGAEVGIVGLGQIGQRVARRCGRGFGCRLLYHQRRRADPALEAELGGAEFCASLGDLLPRCDYLVLCCPLGPDTRGMINVAALSSMRPTAALINVARGGLVDTAALTDALRRGIIAGAGLDTTEPEPLPPDHPLLASAGLNAWVTPHAGTHTVETRLAMQRMCLGQIRAALRGEVPQAALFTL